MDESEKISKEDQTLVELHKSRLENARQAVELREAQMRLFIVNIFKKYGLKNNDQIGTDGTVVRAVEKED